MIMAVLIRVSFTVFTLLSLLNSALGGKKGFYSYQVTDIKGNEISLEKYRGKVTLVVNLASECGYTDEHYKELAALHRELADTKNEPFAVLGFPSNQFGEQEPNDNEDIEKFASETYGVTFPLFAKIDVTDRDAHSAYRFLERTSGKAPTWNFFKFLLDGDGNVVDVWGPRVNVRDVKKDILRAIEKVKRSHNEL